MGERSEHQDSAIVMSSLGRRHAHNLASSRHEFRRSGSEGATPSNTTRFLCFQMFQQHRKMNMELCFAGMVLGVAMECSVSTVSGRATPTCCHSDAATGHAKARWSTVSGWFLHSSHVASATMDFLRRLLRL